MPIEGPTPEGPLPALVDPPGPEAGGNDVAQATFEKSVDSGARCHASTEDYLRTVEATRPTLTPEQVSEFDDEITNYARS